MPQNGCNRTRLELLLIKHPSKALPQRTWNMVIKLCNHVVLNRANIQRPANIIPLNRDIFHTQSKASPVITFTVNMNTKVGKHRGPFSQQSITAPCYGKRPCEGGWVEAGSSLHVVHQSKNSKRIDWSNISSGFSFDKDEHAGLSQLVSQRLQLHLQRARAMRLTSTPLHRLNC